MNEPFNINNLPEIRSQAPQNSTLDSLEQAKKIYRPYLYNPKELEAETWLINGFINDGITLISGLPGGGKTSAIVPLAVAVTGLYIPSCISTPTKRKVIYVTEDPRQVHRMIFGIAKHQAPTITEESWNDSFQIIAAKRSDVAIVAQLSQIANDLSIEYRGITIKPLVVLDTLSANLDIDNENDNSEAGKAIATLKESFTHHGIPLWLISHQAKTTTNANSSESSARGASAFSGDVHTTMTISVSGKYRYLTLKKHRYEPYYTDLEFSSEIYSKPVTDVFNNLQEIKYRVISMRQSCAAERIAQETLGKEDEKQIKKNIAIDKCKNRILDVLAKYPEEVCKNRTWLKNNAGGNAQDCIDALNQLIDDGYIKEVYIINHKELGLNRNQNKTLQLINREVYLTTAAKEISF